MARATDLQETFATEASASSSIVGLDVLAHSKISSTHSALSQAITKQLLQSVSASKMSDVWDASVKSPLTNVGRTYNLIWTDLPSRPSVECNKLMSRDLYSLARDSEQNARLVVVWNWQPYCQSSSFKFSKQMKQCGSVTNHCACQYGLNRCVTVQLFAINFPDCITTHCGNKESKGGWTHNDRSKFIISWIERWQGAMLSHIGQPRTKDARHKSGVTHAKATTRRASTRRVAQQMPDSPALGLAQRVIRFTDELLSDLCEDEPDSQPTVLPELPPFPINSDKEAGKEVSASASSSSSSKAVPAYPTDTKVREQQAKKAAKEAGIEIVKKKRPKFVEDHFDDCGDDLSSLDVQLEAYCQQCRHSWD